MNKLNRIFISYVLKYFFVLVLIFLPILYLSDFFFSEKFNVLYSLAKLPMRYGQSLANLLLWGAWLGTKNLKRRYGEEIFTVLGFRVKDAWQAMVFISAVFMLLDLCVIVPSGSLCPQEVIRTNWCLNKTDNRNFFIYRSPINKIYAKNVSQLIDDIEKIDQFNVFNRNLSNRKDYSLKNKKLYHDVFEVFWTQNNKVCFEECVCKIDSNNKQYIVIKKANKTFQLHDKDFYSIWNEPKKLSWASLARYKNYLKYHKLSYDDITLQYNVFFSRAILLIGMVLCGIILGWETGLVKIIFCAISSCWMSQISIFLPFMWAIILIWFNSFVWIGYGLWRLL